MRLQPLALIAAVLVLTLSTGLKAGQDLTLEGLATCRVSWLDAKDDPVRIDKFGAMLMSSFTKKDDQPFFVPKSRTLMAGLPVLRLFPESAGMSVGFSAVVGAEFDAAKKSVEKAAGVTFKDCEIGEGMRMCGLELAPKKTLMVLGPEKANVKESVVGCVYDYEK